MGSNRLIQQGAKLVMDAADILDDLQILLPEIKPAPEAAAHFCRRFRKRNAGSDAIDATETSIDDIAAKSNCRGAAVSSTLLQLELKRLVKQLPENIL
jgi:DNA processing protein